MSYAKAINAQQDRKGSLFLKNFRRKELGNQSYFANIVKGIHHKNEGPVILSWTSYGK